MPESALRLDEAARRRLWARVAEEAERYLSGLGGQRAVAPDPDVGALRALLAQVDFARPLAPEDAVALTVEGLRRWSLHTSHPRYFGLFNPPAATMGIAADALAAAFNPQVGAWGHNPFAVEVERRLVRELAARFGFDPATADGTFTSGGSEANHTALLAALTRAFPAFREGGVRALPAQPVLYASAESHHSVLKAARASGLGSGAVRYVEVDDDLRMVPEALARHVAADRAAGHAPFLVVATAGTTSAGAVDPLPQIADVAEAERLWLHVDAAWGGAAALVPELAPLLEGTARADSVTFDAHKWLAVPMGAGMVLTRHPAALADAFHVSTAYVPRGEDSLETPDYYARSLQWSRRFIGLKVFLSLAVAGWEGYAGALRHQTAMGDLLRRELASAGWTVVNRTPLPLVCFVDGARADGAAAEYLEGVAREVVRAGAWISTTRLTGVGPALRACVTSFETAEDDVRALVEALARAREALGEPAWEPAAAGG